MSFLRTHRWALYGAVFAGFCAVVPYTIVPLLLGEHYGGIFPMYYDDGTLYRARMQEVLDGHPLVVSSYLHEYKNEAANIAPLGEWLYAFPALILGLSVVLWVSIFLLPATLFFLVYLFVKKLLGENDAGAQITALAAAALVIFGFEFVDYHYAFSLFSGGIPAANVWTRPVNPILGAVALFGLLLLLWKQVCGEWPRSFIPAGVLIAAMVGYYFAWGMALAFLGALFLAYLAQRDYKKARALFFAGVISIILISPYLYSALSSFGGEGGTRASLRTGMFYTHEFIVNTVLLLATLVVGMCFFYAYRRGYVRETQQSWIFFGAMLAAGWIAFNEQVITGRQIWHHHFVQYTVPFSYVTIIAAGYLSIRRIAPRLWIYAVAVLLGSMCLYGLYAAFTMHKGVLDNFREQQAYAPLVEWFSKEAPKGCVVLPVEAVENVARFIPAYTSCDVYLSASAFYAVPDERILHNYLLSLRLQGLRPENAKMYFLEHEKEVRLYRFDDWHQLFGQGKDEWFLNEATELTIAYKTIARENLKELLQRYRMDYLVSDGELASHVRRQLAGLKEVETIGAFHIYSFD